MRSVIPWLVALLLNSPAGAQDVTRFGAEGSLSFGAERLFGFTHASESGGSSVTTFSFLGGSGVEVGATPYSIPRIGFDYVAWGGLSVGLGAEFAEISPQNSEGATILGLNPRVGYVRRASDRLSFWPRAGISYVNLSPGGQSSSYLLAATLEAQFVITPLPHFGLLVGPAVDIGLAGTSTKITQFGIQAGLIGWL